jgi:hypothetical protein
MKYYGDTIFGGRFVDFVKRWYEVLEEDMKQLSTLLFLYRVIVIKIVIQGDTIWIILAIFALSQGPNTCYK